MKDWFSRNTRNLIQVTLAILGLLVVYYFFGIRPSRELNQSKGFLQPREFLELKNNIRAGLAQAMGGAILLIGLYFTWRNIRATERNVEIAQENIRTNQENAAKNLDITHKNLEITQASISATQESTARSLAITQEGQITERFTRAIEQLGDKNSMAIRLGGIYALERIAQDSERDHWPVIEILSAFIRERAAWDDGEWISEGLAEAMEGSETKIDKPLPDVEAVLRVLSRRERKFEDETTPQISLAGTDLRGYNLNGLRLEKMDLSSAHLEETSLFEAQLQGSNLIYAHLNKARLHRANLKNAELMGAELVGARLRLANLDGTSLMGANLQRAVFSHTSLKGAQLDEADLRRAKVLHCNLVEASLDGANLMGVNLSTNTGLTKEQIEDAITDEHTRLPPYLQPIAEEMQSS